MGKFVLKDAYVEVDGTDLSNMASSVTVGQPADEVEATGFGSDYREFLQGLKDGTITVAFFQDFAPGSVHDTLNPVYQSGATFPLVIRPTSAAVGTTNPEFQMTARLFDYTPLAGGVGEAATFDAAFRNADQSGIVVATS